MRFADKNSHQIFIEPEGLTTHELYPNGISTSLPFDVQVKIVHSMKVLRTHTSFVLATLIEYDFFDPRDLKLTYETKFIKVCSLRGKSMAPLAEEAAAQGLMAGLNASLFTQGKEGWAAAIKLTWVYLSLTCRQWVPKNRTACLHLAPNIACCYVKTTPICV